MADPSVRSFATAFNSSGSTTLVLDKPAGTVEGDLLFIFVSNDTTGSITPPAGWSTLYDEVDAGTQTASIYYLVAGDSEPSSYTVTKYEDRGAGIIFAIQDPGDINVHGSNTGGASSTATCPTVTPTADDTLLLRMVSADGGDNTDPHSEETGYTMLDTVSIFAGGCVSVQHKIHTSGATGVLDVSLSGSDEWTGFTVAIAGSAVEIAAAVTAVEYVPHQASIDAPTAPSVSAINTEIVYVPKQASVVTHVTVDAAAGSVVYVPKQAEIVAPTLGGSFANEAVTAVAETRATIGWDWTD